MFDHYIEIGAIEVVGIDDNGEFMLQINPIAETIAPELWQRHRDYMDGIMLELFEKGLVNVEYTEDLEAEFSITEAGKQRLKELGFIDFED